MHIVINPGHVFYKEGDPRNTPGKCSPDKSLREALWNREVADIVSKKLSALGIDNTVAVAESEKVSLITPVKVCNSLCSKLGVSNVLFVSVHVNAAGDGVQWMNAQGWSVWTTRGVTKSDKLASCMFEEAKIIFKDRRVRSDYVDGDPDYESDFYVIKNARCPAVLVENFFMDNKEDCAYLKTAECKNKCAEVIVKGIKRYLNV